MSGKSQINSIPKSRWQHEILSHIGSAIPMGKDFQTPSSRMDMDLNDNFRKSQGLFCPRSGIFCFNSLNIRYIYRKYAPSRTLNSASQHIPFSWPNHIPDSSNVKLTYVFTLILNAWTIGSASTSFTLLPIYPWKDERHQIRHHTACESSFLQYDLHGVS